MGSVKPEVVYDHKIPYLPELLGPDFNLKPLKPENINSTSLKKSDALIVRSVTPVNQNLLSHSNLKFIASATAGIDHINQNDLQKKGVHFCYAPEANSQAVCDYSLTALAPLIDQFSKNLTSLKIGIIGFGNIGKKMATTLNKLGVSIKIVDPFEKKNPLNKSVVFHELNDLSDCDGITFHVPLTKNGPYPSYKMLNTKFLENLKKCILIINSSRGEVFCEQSLVDWQKKYRIPYLSLDVWPNEPKINPFLLSSCHLSSPHIAGYSKESKLKVSQIISDNLISFFELKPNENKLKSLILKTKNVPIPDQVTITSILEKASGLRGVDKDLKCDHKSFSKQRNLYQLRNNFSSISLSNHKLLTKQQIEILSIFGFKC